MQGPSMFRLRIVSLVSVFVCVHLCLSVGFVELVFGFVYVAVQMQT